MPDVDTLDQRILGENVSRETRERLHTHLNLLKKWNPAINLVSKFSLEDGWQRHILDSAQVFSAAPRTPSTWLDFGSGAGFPGLVCRILAAQYSPDTRFLLVESDKRKCAFLRTVLTATGLQADILSLRIEEMDPTPAEVITARAVASLEGLISLCEAHRSSATTCIFPKGGQHEEEIRSAMEHWRFKLLRKTSITDPKGAILVLGDIERV